MKILLAVLATTFSANSLASDYFSEGRFCHVRAIATETRGLHDLYANRIKLDVYVKVADENMDDVGLDYAETKARSWLKGKRWGIANKEIEIGTCDHRSRGCFDDTSSEPYRWCYEL